MSDSEDSTVTYTEISSPYEDLSDIGSPGRRTYFLGSPSPEDYVPSPEEPEPGTTFHLSMYHLFRSLFTPEFLQEDACPYRLRSSQLLLMPHPTTESPGYIPESDPEEDPEEDDEEDPEEDPADYPTDRGDDRDDEEPSDDDDDDDDDAEDAEEEHLAPADPATAPAPFLSKEVSERLLALPTPPPSPLSPYSSPLPQIPSPPLTISSPPPNGPTYVEGSPGSRDARIRQKDALPSPVYETEMPEMCLSLRKRSCRTTDDPVDAIQEIAPTTLEGVNQRVTELATTVD
ncbi:hypothetical protein Tco_1026746 [Tanacetum coccineum]